MRFIARLYITPKPPRPIQAYHANLASAEKWAGVALAPQDDGAYVEIHELVEQHRMTVTKEVKPCAPDAPAPIAR